MREEIHRAATSYSVVKNPRIQELFELTSKFEEEHHEETDVLHGWINALQDRVKAAESLQPVHIFHRAQVGTVCGLLEELRQVKEVKKEEVLAKADEIKDLGTNLASMSKNFALPKQ